MTRGRTIAAAVVESAEMRAALKHLAWNPDLRLTRVVARGLGPAARILRNTTRLLRIMPIRTHAIGAAWHVQHPVVRRMLERLSVIRRRFRTGEIHHKLRRALQTACVASSLTLPRSCFARYAVSADMPSSQFFRNRP